VHWQYFEEIAKVKPHTGTPLKLRKALYVKSTEATGPVLEPMKGAVKVGDELVVRIELRVDRDMEFVHLKDQRGSGTEPLMYCHATVSRTGSRTTRVRGHGEPLLH